MKAFITNLMALTRLGLWAEKTVTRTFISDREKYLNTDMRIRLIKFGLLAVLAAGCAHLPTAHVENQDFLLSFPSLLKPGEQVIGFELHAYNGQILVVSAGSENQPASGRIKPSHFEVR